MKDFEIKEKNKCYEFNDDVDYKRKNIDFNEYGFNRNYFEEENYLDFNTKFKTNCVKREIKR